MKTIVEFFDGNGWYGSDFENCGDSECLVFWENEIKLNNRTDVRIRTIKQ